MQVRFQELFVYEASAEDSGDLLEEEYLLDGDKLELELALRDALVLELPLSPLCAPDCPGLCSECGARLAEAGPGHGHARQGSMWAALKDFRVAGAEADVQQESSTPDGPPVPGRRPDGTPVPGRAKER